MTASLLKSTGLFSVFWLMYFNRGSFFSARRNSVSDRKLFAVAWIASTYPPISKSSSLFTNPFGTVSSAPIAIGITVNFIFHVFWLFLLVF